MFHVVGAVVEGVMTGLGMVRATEGGSKSGESQRNVEPFDGSSDKEVAVGGWSLSPVNEGLF